MRICIINNQHLSFNPRTIKEADALAEAGHDVRVITVKNSSERVRSDDRLVADRDWRYQAVTYSRDDRSGYLRWLISGTSLKAYRQLARISLKGGIAERAFCRYRAGLLKKILEERADLYIAHNLPNLPVAAEAAWANDALLGFDIEDYHVDEDSPSMVDPLAHKLKATLMSKYLPYCDHLSAASEEMSAAVVNKFRVRRPVVLYNVFPLSYASGVLPPQSREDARSGYEQTSIYTAYWFSQAVGLDRGLQDFIQAMPRFEKRVDLHLRGTVTESVKTELMRLAASLEVSDRIFFHDIIHADDLVRDAARFDFGLALEQPINENKKITASNKLFTYFLAGIAPVATDIPGQREVVDSAKGCAITYKPGDVNNLVQSMNEVLRYPDQILERKRLAWDIARARFCWDIEKRKLASAIAEMELSVRQRLLDPAMSTVY